MHFRLVAIVALTSLISCSDEPRNFKTTTAPFVTYLLIDGLDQSVFKAELEAGRLPNIQRLIDEGSYIENGIASFPSMTGYGFYPMLTGIDAPRSGILGLRWFDRRLNAGNLRNYVGRTNVAMNKDIIAEPNFFEVFSEQFSASVNSYMNRGVQDSVKTGWAHTTSKFHAWWLFSFLNAIPLIGQTIAPDHFRAEEIAIDIAIEQLKRKPKIHWVTFATPDAFNHIEGDGPRYAEIVRHADKMIGQYRQASQHLGQEDDRLYIVASDHGVSPVQHNLDLRKTLSDCCSLKIKRGKATNLASAELDEPLAELNDTDGYLVVNGNLSNYLYFRDPAKPGPAGWRDRLLEPQLRSFKGHDVIKTIAASEGIELVAFLRAKDKVGLATRDGEASIDVRGDQFRYAFKGVDPLRYQQNPATKRLMGRFYSADRWLAATHASYFPDALFRLATVVRHPRCGDLVITSLRGYDLARDYELFVGNFKGGHGGLRAELLRVPYILAGSGIKKSRVAYARAEDLGATIRQILQIEPSPQVSGRVLPILAAANKNERKKD